jgi:ADP-ribose pyrophosphatase YjhB (NUDIX family)
MQEHCPMTDHSAPEFIRTIPAGDDRERRMCRQCGFIDYENPKIVVGSVVDHDNRILLCRRAIEPRDGYWTLPAGYLELGESPEAGAVREAWEEARARLVIDRLLATYSITRISQVQLIYRARLESPDIAAGPESREVALFKWEDIPWDDLAFRSVHWALHHFRKTRDETAFAPFSRSDLEPDGL